jgi:ABC-type iron transport system FetAB ATPase subunit
MSFALLRQSGAIEYNIPLLDEVDGPLHKSDKRKFISILLKHLKENRSEQCFVITHDDNTFDGYPVQVIMTTDEIINQEKYPNVIRL